jgi:hypothetical protein
MRALALIAVLLGMPVLSACGSSDKSKILDTERVERAIQDSILEKRNLKSDVSCPSGVEQKKGVTFRCTATYKGGQTPFAVTVDTDAGAVHYVGLGQ